tara:strand:+ start:337 stop:648 length:312 start_codon:yes stop_codon:yes gene_type:complete
MYWIYLFWKDEFLTKYKIKNTECAVETMEQIAQVTIRTGFTVKHGLSEQIRTLHKFLDEMYERKINKLGIYKSSHQLILASISSLIKLQQYREDELCIILKQK